MADKRGLFELAKINARETEVQKAARLEKTNKYMDTYKVNPENWLARLGQRDAQKFVLRHPTSQDVSSWKTPLPDLFGITGDDLRYIFSDPKQRAKQFDILSDMYAKKELWPLERSTNNETAFDYSDQGSVARKISLGPQVIGAHNFTPEHEFMHRGQMVAKVIPNEENPYLYNDLNRHTFHRGRDLGQSFNAHFGRSPTQADIDSLNENQAKAKAMYTQKYMSGYGGGMPDLMGDLPDEMRPEKKKKKKKAKGGAIIIDDGNPAKRRKLI